MNQKSAAVPSANGRPRSPSSASDHDSLRRFLLGQLSEEDAAQIEDRFFSDDDVFESLLDLEDELADDYVARELSAEDRVAFERRFVATASGRGTVRAARALQLALRDVAALSPGPIYSGARPSAFRLVGALAAAILVVSAAVALILETVRLRQDAARWQSERAGLIDQQDTWRRQAEIDRARADRLAAEAARPPTVDQGTTTGALEPVIALALSPGLFRDAASPHRVTLSPGVSILLLQLSLEDSLEFERIRVTLESADGDRLWQQELSRPQPSVRNQPLAVSLPVANLRPADYIVRLEALDQGRAGTMAVYTFQLLRP